MCMGVVLLPALLDGWIAKVGKTLCWADVSHEGVITHHVCIQKSKRSNPYMWITSSHVEESHYVHG